VLYDDNLWAAALYFSLKRGVFYENRRETEANTTEQPFKNWSFGRVGARGCTVSHFLYHD
jgi:hypothetical protein